MSSPSPDTGAPSGVPARAGLARQLYGQGVPLAEIGRRTGLCKAALYHWIDRRVAEDGTVVLDPLPRRRPPATGTRRSANAAPPMAPKGAPKGVARGAAKGAAKGVGRSGAGRARLLARLWHAAERQVAQIEARMGEGAPGGRDGDAEKDAKALALLARTLRELAAIEDEARAAKALKGGRKGSGSARMAAQAGEGDTDGADVRDRDAFRRELARRLDRLRGAGPGDDAAG